MKKGLNKRANILTENLIFIILNIIFLTILLLFIVSKVDTPALLEEKYAKQIALMIDAAEPEMKIYLNMEDAFKEAQTKDFPQVLITDNFVTVKLREKGGYTYSFFNDVKVTPNIKENEEIYFVIEKNE